MSNTIEIENRQAETKFGLRWQDAYLREPTWNAEVGEWFEESGVQAPKVEVKFTRLPTPPLLPDNMSYSAWSLLSYDEKVALWATQSPSGSSKATSMVFHFSRETDFLLFRMRWLE